MKRFIVKGITTTVLVVALAFPPVTSAFADTSPNGPGQPGYRIPVEMFLECDVEQ